MAELVVNVIYPENVGDTHCGYTCVSDKGSFRCERCEFKGTLHCRYIGCNIFDSKSGKRTPVVWKSIISEETK
jgi:hypothetical protein